MRRVATARRLWQTINLVNLRENVLPTRERAHLILEKGRDHAVRKVRLRKTLDSEPVPLPVPHSPLNLSRGFQRSRQHLSNQAG